jgi:hypothetical protein
MKLVGLISIPILLLISCQSNAGLLTGSSALGSVSSAEGVVPQPAISVEIQELLDNPDRYEGAYLEVEGEYSQLEDTECDTKLQGSPAGWALRNSEGKKIFAAGAADLLQQAKLTGLILNVRGRWLRWQGPIGCGRDAETKAILYLDVSHFSSPNPIGRVDASPATEQSAQEGDEAISPVQSETGELPLEENPERGENSSTTPGAPTSVNEEVSTTEPITVRPITPTQLVTTVRFEPTESSTLEVAPERTVSPVPIGATDAAVNTPEQATNTPAPSNSTTAAIPTSESDVMSSATSRSLSFSDEETLETGSLETAMLNSREIHRWPLVITNTNAITVNVASEIDLDVSISVRDPSGNTIAQQNDAHNGNPEVLGGVLLPSAGTYDIVISSANEVSGEYAILVNDIESYTFVFNGTLESGDLRSGIIRSQRDHFWSFTCMAGGRLSATVVPKDNSDLFMRLFGPDDKILIQLHNESGAGESEQLVSFSLADTGFYSLVIGELNFGPSAYEIDLVLE